ncbi:MAG: pyrroline-5-carboxylate reductase, partial [Clostridia bacterium]|nr:pyrroline-5-carboxylate reductase [Clostridia bacterium]
IIGCGFMAKALLKGIMQSEFIRGKKIIVSDVDLDKLNETSDEYGVNVTNDNRFAAENSEYLLLAVKPQTFPDVAKQLSGVCPQKVISIMAGVKKATIKNSFGVGLIKVARCMPNLPCAFGYGMTGVDMVDFNRNTDDTDFVSNLFGCFGQVLSITEDKIDAVTGISGSGPAYAFIFIDSLIAAGVKQGLTADEAKLLAIQTVWGSCGMLMESDKPISELIMNVCSKGVTTIEAVKIFEKNNFRGIVSDAVEACVRRSKELSE